MVQMICNTRQRILQLFVSEFSLGKLGASLPQSLCFLFFSFFPVILNMIFQNE